MKRKRLRINKRSIERVLREIDDYEKSLDEKKDELCRRLAELWAELANNQYAVAQYDGIKDVSVEVVKADGGYTVQIGGESALFIEFGTGITYSSTQHPLAGQLGLGPGTWEPKHYQKKGVANWENPNGWYLPKDKGGGHTFGNPPAMAIYNAGLNIRRSVERVAKEVFSSD